MNDMTDMDLTDLAQRLREAMSASVASARPSFSAVDIRRRHRRHLRLVTIVSVATAVVVLLAAVVVRASLHGLSAPSPVSPGRTGRYVDPSFGWRIWYPRGWFAHQEPIYDGFRLTNFAPDLKLDTPDLRMEVPPFSSWLGWLKAFPADGVAVELRYGAPFFGPPPPPLHDSAFPLSAASFGRTGRYVGGSEPKPLYRTFYGDGIKFDATVWIGPRASGADVRGAWAAVRSLRFPALRTGAIWPGTGWHTGEYYVLGPATRYPVGSVTAIPGTSLPEGLGQRSGVYLIHAPRGFYGLAIRFWGGPSIHCLTAFDPRSRQFFCPGKSWRWDILGLPVGVPRPLLKRYDMALYLRAVTVAQDGHVLYPPAYQLDITMPPRQAMRYWWG